MNQGFLAARVGEEVAEEMIASANRYSAEFLHQIGVVDLLMEAGGGPSAVDAITRGLVQRRSPTSLETLRNLPYQQLVGEIERWVEAVMAVSERHKRSMRYLLEAQRRRGLLKP